MTDKQQTQEQAQQEQAETAGGPVVGTEATARELTPAEADTKHIFSHITHPKKRRFLSHYGNTGGNVLKAARLAGIDRRSHYIWLRDDPEYAEAFEHAQKLALDVVEAEIIRRGIKGYKEPLVYQGKLTGQYVRRYSDNLLMFYAKRRDPAYRDNWTQQIGIMAGGKVQINFGIPRPDGEELEKGNK